MQGNRWRRVYCYKRKDKCEHYSIVDLWSIFCLVNDLWKMPYVYVRVCARVCMNLHLTGQSASTWYKNDRIPLEIKAKQYSCSNIAIHIYRLQDIIHVYIQTERTNLKIYRNGLCMIDKLFISLVMLYQILTPKNDLISTILCRLFNQYNMIDVMENSYISNNSKKHNIRHIYKY